MRFVFGQALRHPHLTMTALSSSRVLNISTITVFDLGSEPVFVVEKHDMTYGSFRFEVQSTLLFNSRASDILLRSQGLFQFNSNTDIRAWGSFQGGFAFFGTSTSLLRTWTKTLTQLAFVATWANRQAGHLYDKSNVSTTTAKKSLAR